jgi:hypothetical protein
VAEWYYIGHYGQLGPLTREQIDELIQGGVIARDTYVWRSGLQDWMPADRCDELRASFAIAEPFSAPPPPPMVPRTPPPATPTRPYGSDNFPATAYGFHPAFGTVRSDRSRALAGVLQLLLPGVGRIYLGYAAYGVLQLVFALCGIGFIWSFIDGIVILSGGVKLDGYGRQLGD